MKNFNFKIGLAIVALLVARIASATVVYNNDFGGVASGDDTDESASTINIGFSVSDSFTLSSTTTLTGVNLLVWVRQGDQPITSLNWYILDDGNPTDPFSGAAGVNTLASGTVHPTDVSDITNGQSFDVEELNFSISTAALAAGTYWLQVDTAAVSGGGPVYWDESDGPSSAYQSTIFGTYSLSGGKSGPCNAPCTGSESFQLLGDSATAPEPGSMLLLGGGLIGLASLRIRKKRA